MIGEMQGDLKALAASSARIEAAVSAERYRSENALREAKHEITEKIDDTSARVSKLENFRIKALAVIAAVTIAVNLAKDGFISTISKVFPL